MKNIHPIGIGANIFGYSTNFNLTREILAICMEYGLNFIDTADVYSNNQSEKFIGKIVNQKSFKNKFFISTKAGMRPGESADGQYTKKFLIEKLNGSLNRLRVECIDFYLLHKFDKINNLFEMLDALQNFSKSGKIKYFGFSNLTKKEYVMVKKLKHNFKNFRYNQSLYNIFCKENQSIIKDCKKNKIFSTTYGCLLRGVLSEKYLSNKISKKSRFFKNNRVKKHLSKQMIKFLQKLKNETNKFGMNIPQFAIYNSVNEGSNSTIIGMRNISQVKNICENFDLKNIKNANKIRDLMNAEIKKIKISYY